jgi:hypothetical protein
MVQLLEMVLIEVGEERGRAGRARADIEVVDVPVPVLANVCDRGRFDRRHGR